jgi:V8-like Glu-specific endopeptidase
MSLGFSRFEALTGLLTGTTTVIAIMSTQVTATIAMNAQEIAQIAFPTTVQINNNVVGGSSGVIIARTGNTYTVLTANHVVKRPDLTYTIHTHTGKEYPVSKVQRLQRSENDPDLAVVTFESPDNYPIATLGNSDQAAIGVSIYVSGYPALQGRSGAERDYEFSPGIVTSRPTKRPQGYTLRYNAVTVRGMSGSPVFDTNGRVVGIHGQGESEESIVSESGAIAIKSGFNSAIPINTFIAMRSQIGLSGSEVKVNNNPAGNPQAPPSLSTPNNARDYYARGLSRLDSGDHWRAIEDFTQAIRLDPNLVEAYNSRGNARYYLEDKQGAIDDYTQAIRLNPNFVDAYNNRANARSDIGDKQGATTDYNQAIQLNAKDTNGYNNPGF